MPARSRCWCALWGWLIAATAAAQGPTPDKTTQRHFEHQGPGAPAEALADLRVVSGLQVELAAAEPLVADPVAIAFDHRGRMWVVEMGDYPSGPGDRASSGSRIKILEDQDDDGYFETAHLFTDQLTFANGLQLWKEGAFVTASGLVAWLADLDGDNACDRQVAWFQGFAEENPQLRANDPTLNVEGWIDVANGLRGGTVFSAQMEDAPRVPISGMGLSIRSQLGPLRSGDRRRSVRTHSRRLRSPVSCAATAIR